MQWSHESQPSTNPTIQKLNTKIRLTFGTNQRNNMAKRHTTDGHSTGKTVSQFDVALETGLVRLSADMPVIGIDALEQFINKDRLPFFHSGLREILTGNRNIEFQSRGT